MTSPHVFEAGGANFQIDVVDRSMSTPILLDFWASWCEPCRALTPVLEKLADEYAGAFVLGKVDTEQEVELAQAFGVQSIPFVCLLQKGQPVDAFAGALPEDQLRAFLKKAGIEPAAATADEPVDEAAEQLATARRAIAAGDLATGRAALDEIAEDSDQAAAAARLADGMAWLETEFPDDVPAAAALNRAREAALQGHYPQAMDSILESISLDRGFGEQLGRKAMLLCFALIGEDSDLADQYRRQLATLMY